MALANENNKINLPHPDGTGGEDLAPFLRVKDLPVGERVSLQLLGHARFSKSQFGEGIILDAILCDKKFAFDVKFKSRNYIKLFRKFGDDAANWTGSVEVEIGNHLGNDYVKVV